IEVIEEILARRGADLDKPDRLGFTPLTMASQRRKFDVVCFLLQKGARWTFPPTVREHADLMFMKAIERDNKTVKLFFDGGFRFSDPERSPKLIGASICVSILHVLNVRVHVCVWVCVVCGGLGWGGWAGC